MYNGCTKNWFKATQTAVPYLPLENTTIVNIYTQKRRHSEAGNHVPWLAGQFPPMTPYRIPLLHRWTTRTTFKALVHVFCVLLFCQFGFHTFISRLTVSSWVFTWKCNRFFLLCQHSKNLTLTNFADNTFNQVNKTHVSFSLWANTTEGDSPFLIPIRSSREHKRFRYYSLLFL